MTGSAGRIRDPIYGYIAFTAIERVLLDHPIAQRLRWVSQSAAAHLVFPEMRVSRFAHSLGAMHLASRFFAAALANAADDERAAILGSCRALVERHQGLGMGTADDGQLSDQGLLAGRSVRPDEAFPVLLVEQGLRLASLVHDLGHLPYSHDFEEALESYFRADPEGRAELSSLFEQGPGGDAVHERVGYALASVVQAEIFNARLAGTPLAKPAEVSLLIARDILNAPPAPQLEGDEHARVLSWLHSLVAGEIDVDRADYVLRDVRHYGLSGAGYDLDRLVDNLVPVRLDDEIVTAVLPQGVSAAESFLLARFRMYTWAVFHHKIQQAAAGLRVAIEDLLESGEASVAQMLRDLVAVAAGDHSPELLARFEDYDDVWASSRMRDRLAAGVQESVEPWSALFLRRRPGPMSLWKRPSDFPEAQRAAWNARLPGRDDIDLQAAWEESRQTLREQGVLVVRLPFRPWKPGPDGESALRAKTPQGLVPLTQLCPLVKALGYAWQDELQLLAFADRPGRIEAAEVLTRLTPALQPQE